MLASESRLLVKDCEEELSAMDRALGATGPSRVRVFVFRDAGEKKRLMGAADTLIAKPWRREVYVQRAAYPHPVLGHELAHVVAGTFGRGPFRVAGALWGLAFDPGLVEGVAVAASPDDDNLSEAQWVHALLEMDALPPVRDLFSHAFFTMAASKSYVIAGAFVRFVQERYGNGVLRSWYGGASIEALTGEDWASLDRRFRESLVRTPLSAEAQSFARARFERPSVFGRKCPHVIDAVRGEADRCRGRNEYARATELYGEVLGRDPHDWSARYGLGMVSARQRDWAAGERELRALIDSEQAPRTLRDWARDALADADLLRGDDEKARVAYRELAARSLDEDFARTEEVKEAAAGDPAGRATVLALLVGGVDRPPDTVVAAERAGEWEGRTASPLAGYLVGRTMLNLGWYADAAPHLDRAIDAGAALPPRVAREAVRLRSVAACALGDRRAALRLRLVVAAPDGPFAPSEGRRLATLRLLDRCSFSSPPEP
jgi:tetratricopeptide (TPR) repeat protein